MRKKDQHLAQMRAQVKFCKQQVKYMYERTYKVEAERDAALAQRQGIDRKALEEALDIECGKSGSGLPVDEPFYTITLSEIIAALEGLGISGGVMAEIHAERRQVEQKGWTPEHDDEHACDEIAALACFYAMPPAARDWDASSTGYGQTLGAAILPEDWVAEVGDRRRELVKSGALIVAEIQRLDRAEKRTENKGASQ